MTNRLPTRAALWTIGLAMVMTMTGASAAFAQSADPNATKPEAGKAAPAKSAGSLTPEAEAALQKKVESYLRNVYAWGDTINVKPGPLTPAPMGDVYQTTVVVSAEGGSDSAVVFVSKDGRYILRGELDDLSVDPFADVKGQMHLNGAASRGPADAKVVVVEFGDLECPVCRQLEPILQQIMPQYPQARLVFKDFPLESVHPWAMQAAVMGHCALQQSSDIFWKYHDTIYDEQDQITPDNATDMLGSIATAAGADANKLKACIADPKSTDAIRASLQEGMNAGVNSTPTVFVDGRKFVGPNANALQQYIEYDLHTQHPAAP